MSTTPQIALDTLLGLLKLGDCIVTEARKTAYRIRSKIKIDYLVRKFYADALTDLFHTNRILEVEKPNLHPTSGNFQICDFAHITLSHKQLFIGTNTFAR